MLKIFRNTAHPAFRPTVVTLAAGILLTLVAIVRDSGWALEIIVPPRGSWEITLVGPGAGPGYYLIVADGHLPGRTGPGRIGGPFTCIGLALWWQHWSISKLGIRNPTAFCIGVWKFIPPLLFFATSYLLHRRAQSRNQTIVGNCDQCGYDLRAHHPGQTCPECGHVIPNRKPEAPHL